MEDEKARLTAWYPGAPGFSRDDIIVAIGLQCQKKRFLLSDVLAWLGAPDKAVGDSSAGQIAYCYAHEFWGVPLFDVVDGRVVAFGVVARTGPNAERVDPVTGSKTPFNVLDEMHPFDELAFRR
jgi:hypothetical protein